MFNINTSLLTKATRSDGSTVSVFPLTSAGRIGATTNIYRYNITQPGPGTNDSQSHSNPHAAMFSPAGDLMVVPDRGADRLYVYHVHGTGIIHQIKVITLVPGTGPRHVLFSEHDRTTTTMFLLGELDNTVSVFELARLTADSGRTFSECNDTLRVKHIQSLSTLVEGNTRTDPNNVDLASELALSQDGQFLYVSNRNTVSLDKVDTLAIYSVDPRRYRPLQFLGLNTTHGKTPRHFSLSPDGQNRFVAVANQVTNNLIIMDRDAETGFVGRVLGNFSFGSLDVKAEVGPVAVIWD